MKLAEEEYKALQNIVGAEYITREPVILDTYNQVWGNAFFFDEKHSVRPAAVLLPADTAEISEVVKVCKAFLGRCNCGQKYHLTLSTDHAILLSYPDRKMEIVC